MQLIQSTLLEQSIMKLHTDNAENIEWFFGAIVNILEDKRIPYFQKTDKIANAMMNIDTKINYIKEQTKLLQHMKKQLELSRSKAKGQIAKALTSYGLDKLEGVQVSSITVAPSSKTNKTIIKILDEDALIKAGFFAVVIDSDAVEQALYSADQRHEVEAYISTSIETIIKDETIRINKRKSLPMESTKIEAA